MRTMPVSHAARLVLALAITVACWPSEAEACSCVQPSMHRSLFPADGATDVPRGVTLRVFTRGFGDGLRDALAAEYRLRPEGGRPVRLRPRVVGTRIDLKPENRLRPSTTYVIEQLFAFAPSGERMSDLERFGAANRSRRSRGAWFPVARFETGRGDPPRRQETPTLQSAEVHFRHGGGDCGPATSFHVEFDVNERPGDVVDLELSVQGVVATAPGADTDIWVGDTMCNSDPVTLQYSPAAEVRLVHRDATGREIGSTAWGPLGSSNVQARSRLGFAPHRTHHPMPTGLIARWRDLDVVTPTGSTASGPTGCEHGFEITSRQEVAASNAPWHYGARSTLDTNRRGERWLAFGGENGGQLVKATTGNVESLPIRRPLWPSDLVAGRQTLWMSASTGRSNVSVFGLDRQGGARWERRLPHEGRSHRLARGGGHVLAVWGATGQPIYRRFLAWALIDETSGELVRPAVQSTNEIETGTTEGPAVAALPDRFLVAWTSAIGMRAGPSYVMSIGLDGQAQPKVEVAIDGVGVPDMAAAGSRAAFVNSDRNGQIRFFLLDGGGALVHGPSNISVGVGRNNRLPRVAWGGQVFAVAWEVYPGGGAYVAAVAPDGTPSAPVRIDLPGEEIAGTLGIAPTDGGFAASYTHHRGQAALVGLQCRSGAPPGPPARIGAVP